MKKFIVTVDDDAAEALAEMFQNCTSAEAAIHCLIDEALAETHFLPYQLSVTPADEA